jgi:hypothetical protein
MRNNVSVRQVDASRFGEQFRRPLPHSYSFARLPRSLRWLLRGQGEPALPRDVFGPCEPSFDHVVLFFADAFGWRLVERALEGSPFLRHAERAGTLSKLTAMFPSTTAAHVTTIHTGQTVGQSGVYAWQYHEPALGTIIESLPFSFYGGPREGLRLTGIDPTVVYPGPSLYEGLAEQGVRSFIVQPREIAHSTCNQVFTAGAEARPYRSLAEALVLVRSIVEREQGPTYTMLYYDRIDTLCHAHGTESEAVAAEVESLWLVFERLFHDRLKPRGRTLLLITADHGHMEVGTAQVHVNRDLPEVVPMLQVDRLGRPLAPAGSRRDFFMHVRPEYLETVCRRLSEALAGRAEVHPTEQLVEMGFFGDTAVSERFRARVGNLVVLPYRGQGVWWQEPGYADTKVSSHGGLTPEEMDIPLFVLSYG